ncbi:MAG: hypothetical protein R2883_04680 [Caldisericia bacterium]
MKILKEKVRFNIELFLDGKIDRIINDPEATKFGFTIFRVAISIFQKRMKTTSWMDVLNTI